MDSPHLADIFREEARIGRKHGELWPDTDHKDSGEYLAFLKRVPDGSGLKGLLATLHGERSRKPDA